MNGQRILLCVSGGIAAYKAASLCSALVQRGAIVDVILTSHAERFIAPLTFAALTGRPVYGSLWDSPERIPHIRLVREAQIALIVPATANVLGKLAQGISDDLLTTALLAARIPILAAPAMNSAMYDHPATQANLAALRDRGYEIIDPDSGFLAERESGVGRLASEDSLINAIEVALKRTRSLQGKRVAITAGPTRESFDPVRYISNPATGAMGIALAAEAHLRGAQVDLILGPTDLSPPAGVHVVRVRSAQEMYEAAMQHASGADIVFASAAVSDWRPATYAEQKLKKAQTEQTVQLVRTPDILAALGEKKGSAFLVGFAAETENHEANAREKLERKHLDAIAVNDVTAERGFGMKENTLALLWATNGRAELGTARKSVLAARLIDRVTELLSPSTADSPQRILAQDDRA
ncbi:MAG: bifunctional phosphopantothenoylcysteine decarboxylase/phosphopantothenate--cysteine ligase CoaBC [Candidatus Eremiobacteraeota bacterium]|nr:bifunctional phosphopantothenoylcysteine decarboxylase/phosphopantothenate--cysteine ligase CoaBC [Candidatus Eremiobacteraeota bacterium]